MNKMFRFKHFELEQRKGVFKFGTDSMLLGCIAEQAGALNILDIGTGTGVLALMMAQKHQEAMVDAVDIEEDAASLAAYNFEASEWNYRLQVYQQSIQQFAADPVMLYDLIVCNPPYFEPIHYEKGNYAHWPSAAIRKARTQETLDMKGLFAAVKALLAASGKFYMICPARGASDWKLEATQKGLHLVENWRVIDQEGGASVLEVLGFSPQAIPVKNEELMIKKADGEYSEHYLRLTADFHLFKNG